MRRPRLCAALGVLLLMSGDARAQSTPAVAATAPSPLARAEALLAEGRAEADEDRRASANRAFDAALTPFDAAGDRVGRARVLTASSSNHLQSGDLAEAERRAREALALLRESGGSAGLTASAYRALVASVKAGPSKAGLHDEAMAAVRAAGAREDECGLLLIRALDDLDMADYAPALARTNEALACHQSLPGEGRAGRALMTLGSIDAAHGQYERAIMRFEEALAFHERKGDRLGTAASLSALAQSHQALGREEKTGPLMARALTIAREMRADTLTPVLTGLLGTFHARSREFARATPLLEEALRQTRNPHARALFLVNLGIAAMQQGELAQALRWCDQAVAEGREIGPGAEMDALRWRAEARRMTGDIDGASADLRDGMALADEARAKSVPVDFMKRGFSEWHQELYTSAVALYVHIGDARGALEAAEQARGRAFLDLLATRDGKARPSATAATPESTAAQAAGSDAAVNPASPVARAATALAARGAAASDSTPSSAASDRVVPRGTAVPRSVQEAGLANDVAGAPVDLENSESAGAPRVADMVATAKRLRSTLVCYWVSPDDLFAWVVSPRGDVHATRVPLPRRDLERLVRDARQPADAAAGGLLTMLPSQRRPWRALHDALIAPIAAHLPRTPDALLTIVPHGPLFQVSFAALTDARGRYLVERYRLHYTPSVGVLAYTARQADPATRTATAGTAASRAGVRALLVGDPGELPGPDGAPLAALPWARREVETIADLIGPSRSTVLIAGRASESGVRAALADRQPGATRSVLHFATHGVVSDDGALSSFLALRGDGSVASAASASASASASTSASTATDGRLTADEVYGLDLREALVVLSACGSARGPTMTGDGVIGFTRAFLYAGASSVVATQWNVPDAIGYEVMRRFYRAWSAGAPVNAALRRAQVETIAALRAGRVQVETPSGRVTLTEHPVLWAAFVVAGEP